MKRRFWVFFAVIYATVATAAVVFISTPQPKAFLSLKSGFTPSEQVLLDRSGQVLHESRANKSVRRLEWTALDQVPEELSRFILRAEDKRFFNHFGVDPIALLKAGWQFGRGQRLRGASTITMQVAEILYHDNANSRRTLPEKVSQIFRAVKLESAWTKREILEAYLNLIYFRGELQGVAAASLGLFGKEPFGLVAVESAALATLIRAPNAKPEHVAKRACHLLINLGQVCNPSEIQSVLTKVYSIVPLRKLAPHVAKHLPNPKESGRIQTTLRLDLQEIVLQALQRQVDQLKRQNLTDAAAVVIDNQTGEILAYVGNIGEKSSAKHVDAAMASRQAGSTLKPFIYGLALDRKLVTAATLIPDTPTDVVLANGIYRPSNYDKRFREEASVRVSLASSLNIPAVRTLEIVGIESAVEALVKLGFTGLKRADFYGPSLALGSMDVRLLELTNAYRAIANKGMWTPFKFLKDFGDSMMSAKVFSEAAAFIIGDIMADRGSRGTTFGWENALSTRFWSAVKTGTSKDMRDNWCIGFSSRYTVGVWAGNLSGDPMWDISGVQGAAPAWTEIMNALHEHESSERPVAPAGIVEKAVKFGDSGGPVAEWFIAGTEPPTDTVEVLKHSRAKLMYPIDQMIVALDPDIPSHSQKVVLTIQEPEPGSYLRLNGKALTIAKQSVIWTPVAGRHRLELVDAQGRIMDQVRFQVRGKSHLGAGL